MVKKIVIPAAISIVILIFVFGFFYSYFENKQIVEGMYKSIMIQTLVGIEEPGSSNFTRLFMSLQALIAYLITAGVLAYIFAQTK